MTRGGQRTYSDLGIEVCLTLSVVFKQPLRQTRGLMRLLGAEIAVPDFSTLSRRGNGLTLPAKPRLGSTPRFIWSSPLGVFITCRAMDSTGLKIFGEGEWLEEKHEIKRKRRSLLS